jgi:hypothetical protein
MPQEYNYNPMNNILTVEIINAFTNKTCKKPKDKFGFVDHAYEKIVEDDNLMRAQIILNYNYIKCYKYNIKISPRISPSQMEGYKHKIGVNSMFILKINFPNCKELITKPILFYNGSIKDSNKKIEEDINLDIPKSQNIMTNILKNIKPNISQNIPNNSGFYVTPINMPPNVNPNLMNNGSTFYVTRINAPQNINQNIINNWNPNFYNPITLPSGYNPAMAILNNKSFQNNISYNINHNNNNHNIINQYNKEKTHSSIISKTKNMENILKKNFKQSSLSNNAFKFMIENMNSDNN